MKLAEPKYGIGEDVYILRDYQNGEYHAYSEKIMELRIDSKGEYTYVARTCTIAPNSSNDICFFKTKEELLKYVEKKLEYDMSMTLKEIEGYLNEDEE